MLRKTVLSFTVIVACFSIPSMAAETIDGWGNLKFGMSIERARSAEPRLNSKEKDSAMGDSIIIFSDADALEIAGRTYRLSASFRPQDRKLQNITLSWESAPDLYIDEKRCDEIYQEHLRMMVNKYGAFDDLKKYNPIASDGGLNMKASEIRQTVDGSTTYFKIVFDGISGYDLDARKTAEDSSMIIVSASVGSVISPVDYRDGEGICGIKIVFYTELPAYVPPLPDDGNSKDKF